MLKRLPIPVLILFLALACIIVPTPAPTAVPSGSTPTVDPSHLPHLPNPVLTPGDTLAVTVSDICVAGYASKVRNVTEAVKNQVYLEYGITSHQPYEYEVDHLVSLELGGSNSVKNLWPEPYAGDWNARVKDKIENKLHQLVCDGQVDLKTAQGEIATDWIAAYLKYIGQP